MSMRKQLNLYIRQVQQRLRLDAGLRGAAVVASTALAAIRASAKCRRRGGGRSEGGLLTAQIAGLTV